MRLKEYRKKKNIRQSDLAKQIGVSRSTVSMWEIGASQPDNDLLLKLSQILDCSVDELLQSEPGAADAGLANTFSVLKTKKVPLLGRIACFASEEHGEYVVAPDMLDADFCLRAQGDSMVGARILNGDIVFIRQQDTVENGQIAAVLIGDEATLKRVYYYPESEKLILNPENPAYVGAELSDVRIIGRAVAFQSVIR